MSNKTSALTYFRLWVSPVCTLSLVVGLIVSPPSASRALGQGPTAQRAVPARSAADSLKKDSLERVKLTEEINHLRIENRNNERSLFSGAGLMNLLYSNLSILVAIGLGFWTLYRYQNDRATEREKREDERFEAVVKSLGSEHEEERIGAAGLLDTFLRPEYDRFYVQVFNVAVGHLRLGNSVRVASSGTPQASGPGEAANCRPASKSSPKAVTYALATILRKAYPRARDALPQEVKEDNPSYTGQYLNASGIRLNDAYLAAADFRDAWLRRAVMRKANLTSAVLTNANLEETDLSCANLESAALYSANMKGANLSRANLKGAHLSGLDAHGVVFSKANLAGVTWDDGAAPGADFSGADLTGATFTRVSFGVDPTYPQYTRPANPEAAEKLDGAKFKDVTGLTEGQRTRMIEKHAEFEPPTTLPPQTPDSALAPPQTPDPVVSK